MQELATIENILALAMGLGLSSACGLRVFIPLTLMSLAAVLDYLPLPGDLAYLDHPVALIVLLSATVVEVGAYYIPWLDNVLDTIATPVAMLAGTLITFGFSPEMHPVWHWSLALLAGGGLAGLSQGATVAARAVSSASTGGLGNPVVSSLEGLFAMVLSVLALLAPFVALLTVLLVLLFVFKTILRKWGKKQAKIVHET